MLNWLGWPEVSTEWLIPPKAPFYLTVVLYKRLWPVIWPMLLNLPLEFDYSELNALHILLDIFQDLSAFNSSTHNPPCLLVAVPTVIRQLWFSRASRMPEMSIWQSSSGFTLTVTTLSTNVSWMLWPMPSRSTEQTTLVESQLESVWYPCPLLLSWFNFYPHADHASTLERVPFALIRWWGLANRRQRCCGQDEITWLHSKD